MWSVFYVYRIEGITTRYVTLIQQQQGQIAYKQEQRCTCVVARKCGELQVFRLEQILYNQINVMIQYTSCSVLYINY